MGNGPTAEGEGQVCGGATEGRARSVRPLEVGGPEVASFDLDTEVLVSTATGEVVEDDPHSLVRRTTRYPERHRDIETVNHDVVEGPVVPAAGGVQWCIVSARIEATRSATGSSASLVAISLERRVKSKL
jgi:hypothetical protein